MKKLIGMAGKWFMKSETADKIVDGVTQVGKNKVDKKKIALVAVVVLGLLLLFGGISEDTFVELFKDLF